MTNIILDTDSYKHSHYLQYPPGTTGVNSYIESRGGQEEATLFFGLQAWLKKLLENPVTLSDVDEAGWICNEHGIAFNRQGWEYIVDKHGGYLPLAIEAAPEGSLVDAGNVLVQVRNTDPAAYWLTSFIETSMLRGIWYPTTVATKSHALRRLFIDALERTSDNDAGEIADFMLHDFGARGVSSEESAGLGGLAHLLSFRGTDTMSALLTAKKYYKEAMAGFSVPASEHSTMTSWTKSGEADAYSNMLGAFKGQAIISIVADSYDIYNAVDNIFGDALKSQILENAAAGSRLVVRPDSGDPETVPIEIIGRLMDRFEFTVNSKGYRVLPDYLRVLQGDGVTPVSIAAILSNMEAKGLSAENIVFGMGSGLLQQVNRDTQKFAMKCSAIEVNGKWRDVFKDPVTDSGKSSKPGILALNHTDENWSTVRLDDNIQENHLRPVYENGKILVEESLATIRRRVSS